MLRFNIATDGHERSTIETLMREFCRRFVLITLRETTQGNRLEYSYHVKLKPKKAKEELKLSGQKPIIDLILTGGTISSRVNRQRDRRYGYSPIQMLQLGEFC